GTGMDTGARAGEDGFFELFPREPWRSVDLEYWGTPGERGRASASFAPEQVTTDGDLGDLRLSPARGVRLRVTDTEGRPIAGARTRPLGGPTDERGETFLPQLSATSLRVAARGRHEAEVAVPPKCESIKVVLARGPELALSIRAADDAAPGELGVELEGAAP